MNHKVSIEVEGKVIVDADVTKADEKLKGLHRVTAGVIGNGAPINTADTGVPKVPVAPPQHRPGYERAAERGYDSVMSSYHHARTPSQWSTITDRIEKALYNAQRSGNSELAARITTLNEEIRRLEQEFHRARTTPNARLGGASVTGAPAAATGAPVASAGAADAGGIGDALRRIFSPHARSGMNTLLGPVASPVGQSLLGMGLRGGASIGTGGARLGPLGGVAGSASKLISSPLGIGLGAVGLGNWAFNLASNHIEEGNAPAFKEIEMYANLARQYHSTRNFMGLFRDSSGRTNDRFRSMGYSAPEAARVAALYDRPGSMMDDTEKILQFSRGTGIEESKVANMASSFRRAGINWNRQSGSSLDNSFRTLKLALAEGVKAGISQSETLSSMNNVVQKNFARGQSTNDTALAYFASISRVLNTSSNTNNQMLRGEKGLNTMQGFMSGLASGGDDMGIKFALASSLMKKGLPSAQELGMVNKTEDGRVVTSDVGKYFMDLKKSNPLVASTFLMEMSASGRFPQVTGHLAEEIDKLSGGDLYLATEMLKQINPNASAEQRAAILGRGGLSSILGGGKTGAQSMLNTYKKGESFTLDPQGNNEAAFISQQLAVAKQDQKLMNSIAQLNVTKEVQEIASAIKDLAPQVKVWLSQQLNQSGNVLNQSDSGMGSVYGGKDLTSFTDRSSSKAGEAPKFQWPWDKSRGGEKGEGIGASNSTLRTTGAPTGLARTLSAISWAESQHGTHRNTNIPGKAAVGMFQMQSRWLTGPSGWGKDINIGPRDRSGRMLAQTNANEAIARRWQIANPDEANKIAVHRLGKLERAVRRAYLLQSRKVGQEMPSDAHIAGIVGTLWHENGGGNISAINRLPLSNRGNPLNFLSYKGRLPMKASEINNIDAGDGVGHRSHYQRVLKAFQNKNLTVPPKLRDSKGKQTAKPFQGFENFKKSVGNFQKSASKTFNNIFNRTPNNKSITTPKERAAANALVTNTLDKLVESAKVIENPKIDAWCADVAAKIQKALGKEIKYSANARELRNNAIRAGYTKVSQKDARPGDLVFYSGIDPSTKKPYGLRSGVHVETVYKNTGGRITLLGSNNTRKPTKKPLYDSRQATIYRPPPRKGYKRGGYTGDFGEDDVAGVVHGREFVINARSTQRFRPLLEAINAGNTGSTAGAASVNVRVDLSGQLNIDAYALSRQTRDRIEDEYQTFQQRTASLITADIQNAKGPR